MAFLKAKKQTKHGKLTYVGIIVPIKNACGESEAESVRIGEVLVRFSPQPIFPASNVKPMASNRARVHVPTAARLSVGSTVLTVVLTQYISHLKLLNIKTWKRYIQ